MKKVLIIILLIFFILFLYGKYIEVGNFKIKEYTIISENIPESFKELKIVHFSDILYNDNSNIKLNELVDNINNLEADIIVFSGDLFNKDYKYSEKDYDLLTDTFKNMNASLFKFAVIGDNDKEYLDTYKDILYESDFILLDNENKLLFYKDITPINIIGISSDYENIDNLFISDVEYSYTLAITHEPDNLKDLSNYDIDTILSGHSLGGIINVPYYGGIIKKDGANTYINEYYELNNTSIYISNGIGNEKYNFRLFNTPSINVYRFNTN